MIILHISDWHGHIPRNFNIDRKMIDIIFMTGDMCEGIYCSTAHEMREEAIVQMKWMDDTLIPELARISHTIYCVPGNHDWLSRSDWESYKNMTPGLNVVSVEGENSDIGRISGFPHQPRFKGWNYEADGTELKTLADRTCKQSTLDFLLIHSPPRRILDENRRGEYQGNPHVDMIVKKLRPAGVFFGHIHESRGAIIRDGILYSNASETFGIYEYEDKQWTIKRHPLEG